MADVNLDKLAEEVSRRIYQQSLGPVPRLFLNDTVTETDGSRDLLQTFWQGADADRLVMVQISISPAAAAGVYRTDGPGVTNNVGQYIPAGGGVLYLFSLSEVRYFRMQAATPGGTMPFAATGFVLGAPR